MKALPVETPTVPFKDRWPNGFWKVVEIAILAIIVAMLILGGVI